MKKFAALTSLILGLMAAAPALGAEQPLLLVVSDFDAALRRDAQVPPRSEQAAIAPNQELDRILALLRHARSEQDRGQSPTTARPL